ncbi:MULTISPECIES: hypothetical protein [unclassified Bradyrhizobium]
MQTQAAASRPATMPFLAFNRKDTGGESIGRLAFEAADLANNTGKRFQCGGIVAGAARLSEHPLTQLWSPPALYR